jgi:hypothetical protein
MRPNQQNRRMRGRGNRKGPNPLTRSYESNGPDVKIRGSAQQIAEKYTTLARDAQASGDRVMAENYLQHAEHYNRIIAAAQAQLQIPVQRDYRDELDEDEEQDAVPVGGGERSGNERKPVDGAGPQPVIEGNPAEVILDEGVPVAVPAEPETKPEKSEAPKTTRRVRRPRKAAKPSEEGEESGAAAPEQDPELAATGS